MNSVKPDGLPERHRPVHQPLLNQGNRSVIVFLTVCAANRNPILANAVMHQYLLQAWQKADSWLVGRYTVMPDHLHLFCAPGSYPPLPLATWVAYWKRLIAFSYGRSLWQKNFWDTQLRLNESYAAKWEYVLNNPVRAGLVTKADDWAYQGELNLLRWHN